MRPISAVSNLTAALLEAASSSQIAVQPADIQIDTASAYIKVNVASSENGYVITSYLT
jgi:hypothetical protein